MRKWKGSCAGACRKGKEAAAAGLPRESCPYSDKSSGSQYATFLRGMRNAWRNGYDETKREMATKESPPTTQGDTNVY